MWLKKLHFSTTNILIWDNLYKKNCVPFHVCFLDSLRKVLYIRFHCSCSAGRNSNVTTIPINCVFLVTGLSISTCCIHLCVSDMNEWNKYHIENNWILFGQTNQPICLSNIYQHILWFLHRLINLKHQNIYIYILKNLFPALF
jgi:hypothetical protein